MALVLWWPPDGAVGALLPQSSTEGSLAARSDAEQHTNTWQRACQPHFCQRVLRYDVCRLALARIATAERPHASQGGEIPCGADAGPAARRFRRRR